MNPLMLLRGAVREVEVNIAVRIDDRDLLRIAARHWYHNGPRTTWIMLGAVPFAPSIHAQAAPLLVLAALLALVYIGSRLADRTHEVGWIDQVHPCPLCPAHPGGDGHGGGGWHGDDLPSAPPPMGDLGDDRIRAMVGDLDAQHYALIEEVAS